MVKVELHQNYGSVYDFAVSRFVTRLSHFHILCIPLLIARISGWVKRTIDPVVPPSAPSATTSTVADADTLGITSSMKTESDTAAPVKDYALGIKVAAETGAI